MRQKARSAATLIAISIGVMGLLLSDGFIRDIFIQLGEAVIRSQTGHAQIARQGYFVRGSQQPHEYLLSEPPKRMDQLRAVPAVEDAMARLSFSGLLSNGRADVSIIGEGVEIEKEDKLGTYVLISEGRKLTAPDQFGILVGAGVAQSLGLKPGDFVTLLASSSEGAINTLDLEVVGTFRTFSKEYDNRSVKIALSAAQELVGSAGANTIVVLLKNTEDTEGVVQQLREAVPPSLQVMPWYELNDFYPKTVQLYERQFGGLRVIILLMVLLSVFNTVNMNAYSRMQEFGTMAALGSRPREVFKLVLLENTLLGVVGGTLGMIVGVLLAQLISTVGIPMPPPPNADLGYVAYVRITFSGCATAFIIGFLAALLASVVPALRVARVPVAQALRQGT